MICIATRLSHGRQRKAHGITAFLGSKAFECALAYNENKIALLHIFPLTVISVLHL